MSTEFQKFLKKYLEDNELTQEELAKKLEIRGATISAWVNHGKEPKLETFFKLCEVLAINPLYLGKLLGYNTEPLAKQITDELNRLKRAAKPDDLI